MSLPVSPPLPTTSKPGASDPPAERGRAASDTTKGNSGGPPKYVGWARVDGDHVLRGWMADRSEPGRRFVVEIFLDGDRLGEATADRLDPKLVSLGEGDGYYAFAAVIPARYRDGQPHRFDVRARDVEFTVRAKESEFTVPEGAPMLGLELEAVTLGAITGHLVGGARKATAPLELWQESGRLDLELEVRWIIGGMSPGFWIAVSPEIAARLAEGDLTLATPGMMEGAPEAAATLPRPDLSLFVEESPEGQITIAFAGRPGVEDGAEFRLGFANSVDGSDLGETSGQARGGRVTVERPQHLSGLPISLSVWYGDRSIATGLPVRPARPHWVQNGAFRRWDEDRPVDWEMAEGVLSSRGFFAFPQRVAAELAVTGDVVRLEPTTDAPLLMTQRLVGDEATGNPSLALLARASAPCRLSLSLEDGQGRSLGTTVLDVVDPASWELAASELKLDGVAQPPFQVHLSLLEGSPDAVEVAGIALGARAFDYRPPAAAKSPAVAANLVENADLQRWPKGLIHSGLTGQTEVADGWVCMNRGTSEPFAVRALVGEDGDDGIAFGVAAAKVSESFRIEIRLDERADSIATGRLSLEVGMPQAVRRLASQGAAAVPAHVLIDRVLVLRRETFAVGDRLSVRDRQLGVIARRLLVSGPFYRYDVPFDLRGHRPGEQLSWGSSSSAVTAESILVLEFRRPFALAVRNLYFGAELPEETAQPTQAHLALEDRAIASQVALIQGLEAWGHGPAIRSPGQAAARPERPPLRWRWTAGAALPIEVVVCMHNAADETLACLASLTTTTAVPHTVRIIDDGSDAVAVQRVAAFVESRPWMRLEHNETNLGYTATADAALRDSEAELVVLLNSDTIVTPGWLEGLLECMLSDDQTAMVGPVSNAATFQSVPVLKQAGGAWKTNPLPEGWTAEDVARVVASVSAGAFPEVPLLNGFCTLIRRSAFIEVGGFNVGAFPQGYGEENDLCLRVTKAGYRLRVADNVYVYHSKSASFGDKRRAELAKRGGAAFQKLHPDVDVKALTDRFGQDDVLVKLRADIAAVYEAALTGGGRL